MAAIIWLATDISLCAESNIDSVGLFASDMRALGASNINIRLNFRLRSIGLAAERVAAGQKAQQLLRDLSNQRSFKRRLTPYRSTTSLE